MSFRRLGRICCVATLLACGSNRLRAQCIVPFPGGSRVNPNRPAEADTPVAGFSPLAAVNGHLPSLICFTAGYRARFEGYSGANFLPNAADSYLLTRFRFGALIKPSAWFKVYAELQDADAFGKTPPAVPPYQETWDLRRAYVDFGDIEAGAVALRVGRLDLNFGDGLLIGTSYWRNASRGYDAVQAVANASWIKITAFAASPVVLFDNGLSHHQPGNNIYGLDARLSKVTPKSVLEPFFFWRLEPRLRTEEGALANLDQKTIGARLAGTVGRFMDYETEGAGQFGNLGSDRIRAWAWMGSGGYTLTAFRHKARMFGGFDFASGDRNAADGVHGAFDQISPNIHDHLGLADQFARQNLKAVRTGARVWLRGNWILATAWNDYWLASATDALYNSSAGVVARDVKGRSGTHIAEEYDVQTSYRLDRNLEFGAGLAHILPGRFLVSTGHPASYHYSYLMMSYNFF
jgi:hypothetical protein